MKRIFSFLLLVTAYVAQAQTAGKVAYYYQGKKISFTVNNTRLFIRLKAGEDPASRRIGLAALMNLPDTAVKPTGEDRMIAVQLPAGLAASRARSMQASLNRLSFVEFVHPCFTSAYGKEMGYGDGLVVKLKAGTSAAVFTALLKQTHCSILKKYPFADNIYVVSAGLSNQYNPVAIANRFFETGLFDYAEPDLTLLDGLFFVDPNDPFYSYQWAHQNTGSAIQYNGVPGADMKVQQAWGLSTGAGIKIAVIDEGVDTGHADLKPNLLQGYDCISGTANPGDGKPRGSARAHGTNCTGIIAAVANNGIGVAGVAPDSKIIPINLAQANGFFTTEANIAAGFDYAWQNGADVISNSWGGGSPSNVIDDAIARAVTLGRGGKGAVVLFASGNNNTGIGYPASNNNVISVGGVNMCGKRKSPASSACDGEYWGASYGVGLDIVAPCVKIVSTDLSGSAGYNTAAGAAGDYYFYFNGTSSATPAAAGVAALVLAANNNLTVSQVRSILETTCDKLPGYSYSNVSVQPNGSWNNETGHGRVNAFNAVQAALSGLYCNVRIQSNGSPRFCPGGNVQLSVVNPAGTTVYQWRKDSINISTGVSITAAASGSYDVVATAGNGCVAVSAPIVVTALINSPALAANSGVDTFICAGTAVKLGGNPVASGGAPLLVEKNVFGMDWQSNSFVKFSLQDPLHFDTIATNMVSDSAYNAGQFFSGGDFTPYGYYALTEGSNKLFRVDTATGAALFIGPAPAPYGYTWCGLTWDPQTKNIYALASAASGSSLCIIDPFTAAVTPVAPVPVGLTEWVVVNNNGDMYTMSDNNYVYRVNKQTGSATPLPNPVGADVVYEQDADTDPVTNNLYLTTIVHSQNYASDLRVLDTVTGMTSVIGSLGGLSEIDATGIAGPAYQYNWMPAAGLNSTTVAVPLAGPLTTTTYTLQVTDMCGNTASSQVTVHVSTPPPAAISAAADSICVGEVLRLHTAANSAYTYQWYLNGAALAGATDSFFLAGAGGAYTVHIVNGACDSLSAPFTVKTCAMLLNNNAPDTLCATYFYDSGGATGNYSNGASFTKTIAAATPGSLLRLNFSAFSTEPGNDVLTLYDGPDTSSPVLAVLSGTPLVPAVYTAVSGKITLQFTSNGTINGAGWAGTLTCYQPAVYRSKMSGSALNAGTWELKSAGIFIPAADPPHLYDDSIIIQPSHTVSIDTAWQADQLWVQHGATLQVAAPFILGDGAGTDLLSEGFLRINAAGSIGGKGTIVLKGSLDNSASVNSHVFVSMAIAGTAAQTILAGGSFSNLYIANPAVTFNLANAVETDSLTVSNGGGNIQFAAAQATPFTINKALSLLNGRLIMGNHTVLNLGAACTIAGGNRGSFVEGPVSNNTLASGVSQLRFPIGKTAYRPVVLTVTHLSAGLSTYQAEAFDTAPANRSLPYGINAVSNRGYFNIANLGSQPVSQAAVTLGYDSTDGVTDAANLRIAMAGNPVRWSDIGGTGTADGNGSIMSAANFTGFGDFVLANATGGSNAFAVRWLQATAYLAGRQVKIDWTIGNEAGINTYTVERSTDGIHFSDIAVADATAQIAAEKQYEAVDRLPLMGTDYYRIRWTDNGGHSSYSKTVQVSITEAADFVLWPNPAIASVNVLNRQAMLRLQCYGSTGQLVYDVKPMANRVVIPVKQWAAGIYQVKITVSGGVLQTRFIKQ